MCGFLGAVILGIEKKVLIFTKDMRIIKSRIEVILLHHL